MHQKLTDATESSHSVWDYQDLQREREWEREPSIEEESEGYPRLTASVAICVSLGLMPSEGHVRCTEVEALRSQCHSSSSTESTSFLEASI